MDCVSHNVPHQCCFFRHSVVKVKRTDPVDKLKDEAEFATSPERLAHLDDVFVFKTAQQAQLTQCCLTHRLIVCNASTHHHTRLLTYLLTYLARQWFTAVSDPGSRNPLHDGVV